MNSDTGDASLERMQQVCKDLEERTKRDTERVKKRKKAEKVLTCAVKVLDDDELSPGDAAYYSNLLRRYAGVFDLKAKHEREAESLSSEVVITPISVPGVCQLCHTKNEATMRLYPCFHGIFRVCESHAERSLKTSDDTCQLRCPTCNIVVRELCVNGRRHIKMPF